MVGGVLHFVHVNVCVYVPVKVVASKQQISLPPGPTSGGSPVWGGPDVQCFIVRCRVQLQLLDVSNNGEWGRRQRSVREQRR